MTLLDLPSTIDAGALHTLVPPAGAAASIDPASPAFEMCRRITRDRARNFYLGLRLAPEPRRSALLALYTWMRHADDLADAGGPVATPATRRRDLARLRDLTIRAFASGTAPDDAPPWWAAFRQLVRGHPIPQELFTQPLDALERDSGGAELADTRDLAWYTDRVAGTVATACVIIWGVRRAEFAPRAQRLAILRARAVQLTNILRDIREDLESVPARRYIPRDSLRRHALTGDALLAWRPEERCVALIQGWIDQARALYLASEDLELLVSPSCARVAWALAAMYRALLERIALDPSAVSRGRVRVPPRRRVGIAVRGWLGVGLAG